MRSRLFIEATGRPAQALKTTGDANQTASVHPGDVWNNTKKKRRKGSEQAVAHTHTHKGTYVHAETFRRSLPLLLKKDCLVVRLVRTIAVCRRADDARPFPSGGQALFDVGRLRVPVSVCFGSRGSAVPEISGGTAAPFTVSATEAASASRRTGNGRVEAQLVRLKVPKDGRETGEETAVHFHGLSRISLFTRRAVICALACSGVTCRQRQ